jgi:hypothetical protein
MARSALLLPLLLILACDGGTAVVDDTGEGAGPEDSGEIIGGETGESEDTADSGDSGDTGTAEPDVAWDLTGDFSGTSFSLVSLNPSDFSMADILVEGAAAEHVEFTLEPPDDYLVESEVPGMYYAFFAGAVHDDDGDEKWDPDEAWYGASSFLTIYIDGVVPPDVINLGLHTGWNSVVLGGPERVIVGDVLAQPLPVTFSRHIIASGTTDETIPADARVTTIAGSAFAGTPTEAIDEGAIVDGGWSLELFGDPPANHYADIDGDGATEAVELLTAYTDGNGNHNFDWDGADTPLGFACVDGAPLIGWWIAPDPDLTALLSISSMGGTVGWNGLVLDDLNGPHVASTAELEAAVLSTSCTRD